MHFILNFLLSSSVRDKLKRKKTLLWLLDMTLMLIIACIAFTVAFKYIENTTWIEAIWQVWQTATTVGYGNAPAESLWGRIATMVFGLVGIAILGAIIGAVFDYRDEMKTKRRLGLLENPIKDGIVVFNFPGTTNLLELINELRFIEPEVGVCVVDNKIEQLPQSLQVLHNVHFLRGSIIEENTYKMANLNENKTVIVFPADPTSPDSDATTKVAVEMIEKFITDKTRVIHILVDSKNNWLFEGTKSTSVLENLEILALVQECQDPYSAPIIQRLLLNTEGANPDTMDPGPLVGWTWGEFMTSCVKVSEKMKVNCNPFALVKAGKPVTCPPPDMKIEEGDKLSVVVRANFVWEDYLPELVRIKKGQ